MIHIILALAFVCVVADEDAVCITTGRFRARDPTCKNYILCVRSKGALLARQYICPETAIFNPSTNRCSFTAHCIDDICNNLPSSVTKIPDPNSNDCKTYIECVGPEGGRFPVINRCDVGYFNKDLLPEPGCCLIANCGK